MIDFDCDEPTVWWTLEVEKSSYGDAHVVVEEVLSSSAVRADQIVVNSQMIRTGQM